MVRNSGLDFDALQLRLHPAASRVKMLSQQSPASIVFFDVLCIGERDLREQPFEQRRRELEALLGEVQPPLHLTPATSDFALASDWFQRFEGAGFDGVMAKATEGIYEPDTRVMLKVKHERDCDCVVGGFRWHKAGDRDTIGSLLLGLYDDSGALHHVGVCASFTAAKRRELVKFLAPYRTNTLDGHPWRAARMGHSRWSYGKDLSWEPLRPELVVEVAYDHMQGDRFRHTAQFRRWRTDKPPGDCTYAQLEVVPPEELAKIASGRARRVIVGIRRLLGRTNRFRDIAEIDANAGPRGGAASHRIDEDVFDGDVLRRPRGGDSSSARVLPAPRLCWGSSRRDQRHFGFCGRGKGRPGTVRSPSCGSAAAMGRRRFPRPRLSQRDRAGLRASRVLRPLPRAGRPSSFGGRGPSGR